MQQPRRDDAFTHLYARHWERLVVLCRAMLPHRPDDAEAVAQEAFLRAWASMDRFSVDRPFWPWLSTIARRLCIDYARQDGRDARIKRRTRYQRRIAALAPEELSDMEEEHRLASRAFEALVPDHQRLVRLRDLQDWSYERIAVSEGVTVEAVRGSLKRARAALRRSYQRLERGLVALPAATWWRRCLDRNVPWMARLGEVRPPTCAAAMVLMQALVALVVGGGLPASSTGGARASAAAAAAAGAGAATGTGVSVATPDTRPPAHATTVAPRERTPGVLSPVVTATEDVPHGDPAEASYDEVTVAPNGEVYAVGQPAAGTGLPRERMLVRSVDGGVTWTRLRAAAFPGGRLLFPPAYPADDRIFAAGNELGLWVSLDGGDSFLPLTSMPGSAAMSPDFSAGHPVFITGDAPGWFYDADRQVAVPTGLVVPAAAWRTNFAFSPRYALDRTVYVGSHLFATEVVRERPTVYRCRSSDCTIVAQTRFGDLGGAPEFAVAQDGTVWAWSGVALWRSGDGVTFSRVVLPPSTRAVPDGVVSGVLAVGDATFLTMSAVGLVGGGLYRSVDDGRSWQRLASDDFPHGVVSLAALADGTLLASTPAIDRRDLLRSTDGGATWHEVL